jgi:hypothetical protein
LCAIALLEPALLLLAEGEVVLLEVPLPEVDGAVALLELLPPDDG